MTVESTPDGLIHYRCPACDRSLLVPPRMAGREVTCPECRVASVVPAPRGDEIMAALPVEPVAPIERPRPATLRGEDPSAFIKKPRRNFAGVGTILGVLFVGGLIGAGVFMGWWQDKNRLKKTLRQGLAGQGIQVDSIALEKQADGSHRGTAIDKDGNEWVLARVWNRKQPGQQEMVYWMVRPKEQGRLEKWYKDKLQPTMEDPIKSITVTVQENGCVRGTVTNEGGALFEFWEEMNDDPSKNMLRWKVAESAYEGWLKWQIGKKNKIKLETLRLQKVRDKFWQGEGATKEGWLYNVSLEKGHFPKADAPGGQPPPAGSKSSEQFRWWVTPKQ